MKTKRLVIKTDRTRLVLKQLVEEDAKVLFQLIRHNRQHLSRFGNQIGKAYPNLESVRRSIISPIIPSRFQFGIWHHSCLVGMINLSPMTNAETMTNDLAEIGYWIGREFCQQGLATSATRALVEYSFEKLGILTILAAVHPKNIHSLRVLEKAGFRLESARNSILLLACDRKEAMSC